MTETKLQTETRVDIKYIKAGMVDIKDFIKNDAVTKKELDRRITPLERIVYGGVGMTLIAVFGYIINLAIK